MERLLRKRFVALGYSIIFVYAIIVLLLLLVNKLFQDTTLNIVLYILLLIGFMRVISKEIIVLYRIRELNANPLFKPNKAVLWLKGCVMIISHILFWVAAINEWSALMVLCITVQYVLVPAIVLNSVYETEKGIICKGIHYIYHEIEKVTYAKHSPVVIWIDNKDIGIEYMHASWNETIFNKISKNVESE